jgi:hypothetical protein
VQKILRMLTGSSLTIVETVGRLIASMSTCYIGQRPIGRNKLGVVACKDRNVHLQLVSLQWGVAFLQSFSVHDLLTIDML